MHYRLTKQLSWWGKALLYIRTPANKCRMREFEKCHVATSNENIDSGKDY